MTAPVKKPFRVTMFWSDEAALVQDFNAKHSEKMVEWARAFFDRYDFTLDVVPDPAGPIKEAYRYALAKSGGYEPDLAAYEEVADAWKRARLKSWEQLMVAERDLENLRTEEAAKRGEIDLQRTLLAGIPPGHTAEREEARTRLDALLARFLEINESIARLVPEVPKLQQKLDNIDLIWEEDLEARNFDLVPRRALGAKITSSLPFSAVTGFKMTDENVKVWDESRLKVLHCRFKPIKTPLMSVENPHQAFGVTRRPINFNRHGKDYVWDGWLIMINTNRHEDITLAHEAVHAGADHSHPLGLRKKTLGETARTITMDQAGKLVMPSQLTYDEFASYSDGPNNSVMNYNAKGLKSDQAILEDLHKYMLETYAFFVLPPQPAPKKP